MTEKQVAILASYFTDAAARIGDMVLHPTGRTEAAQQFRAGRAAAQAGQIDVILQRLKKDAAAWLGSDATLTAAVHAAREAADRQAVEAKIRVESMLPGSFDVVDERVAAVFAQDAAADFYKAADSMGDRAKRVLRQTAQLGLDEAKINRILALGVIQGAPVQTIRELRKELEAIHGKRVTIIDKNGDPIEFKAGYYASMVARTKTRDAVEHARHGRLRELGIELVVIIGRESDSFCTTFLGQAFSIAGDHPKYPPLASLPGGGPPFHPNCSKSTRPFVEQLASGAQLRDAEPLDDARKLIGMDVSQAQRAYKDLQIRSQIADRYDTTETALFAA